MEFFLPGLGQVLDIAMMTLTAASTCDAGRCLVVMKKIFDEDILFACST